MKNNYICNCIHHDFTNKNYKYWENRNVTSDEKLIIQFISNIKHNKRLNILHIGIGNSYLYEKLKDRHAISGITISKQEISKSKMYKDKNYKVFYCDKFSKELNKIFNKSKFDLIVDNNLKSYSCCQNSFDFMFKNLSNLLVANGSILTSKRGMGWVKKIIPKISFNLKNFFHFKLKEIDGDLNNIFTISEAKELSVKNNLKLISKEKVTIFKKQK